ncbi:MAG: CDP-alcohol phosphatidyltransferase family protein [Gammaproteobacteria bacterium]
MKGLVPNALSLFRIGLVVPVVWLMDGERYPETLAVFALAGFTDGLDGFLAKRFNDQTRLGSFLDPLADKLLLVSTFLMLGLKGLAPTWLVGLVVGRDVVIVAGAVAYHFLVGRFHGEPTLLSKLNTVTQILFGLLVVANAGWHFLPAASIGAAVLVVTGTTLASGVDYVWIWGRRARRHFREARRE